MDKVFAVLISTVSVAMLGCNTSTSTETVQRGSKRIAAESVQSPVVEDMLYTSEYTKEYTGEPEKAKEEEPADVQEVQTVEESEVTPEAEPATEEPAVESEPESFLWAPTHGTIREKIMLAQVVDGVWN